jgi:hypothetical protein
MISSVTTTASPPIGDDPIDVEGVELTGEGPLSGTVRLDIGGTRGQPVLFSPQEKPDDDCDDYSSLVRQR